MNDCSERDKLARVIAVNTSDSNQFQGLVQTDRQIVFEQQDLCETIAKVNQGHCVSSTTSVGYHEPIHRRGALGKQVISCYLLLVASILRKSIYGT